MKIILNIAIGLLAIIQVYGQGGFFVRQINEKITIDGVLSEDAWSNADTLSDFWQNFPTDSVRTISPTKMMMLYDDDKLYVAAICKTSGNNYVVPSLRRDFRGSGNDNITLLFDPFNDRINAVFFGTNPYGVKREGLISDGGNDYIRGFSTSWDNIWECEVKRFPNYWIAELAIPFSTLRFNAGSDKWSFNSYRFDTQTEENSTWMRVPQNQNITGLSFMGDMNWEKPLESSGSNISIIPYVIGSASKDYENAEDAKSDLAFGGDAKISVTSGLNLDLTLNPDFSQVEVDQQITNLDRFEIFFPEKRQFFLENADLFGNFGFNTINPFFSRRIGVAKDTSTGSNISNRIYAGARLNGKLNDNWRLGLLNMQTAKDDRNALNSFNYFVGAVQRKIWSRSNIGLIFVNKQAYGDEYKDVNDSYNRVVGMDFNFANSNNTFRGKTFMHYSLTPNEDDQSFAHGMEATLDVRSHEVKWIHEYVGSGYNPQVGFVRRTNYHKINPSVAYKFYPKGKKINQHELGVESQFYWQPGIGKTDHMISLGWQAEFPGFSFLRFSVNNNYVFLFDAFDPSGTDSEKLPANTEYNYWNFSGSYSSARSNPVHFSVAPYIGQYYNGNRYGLRGELVFRFQPKASVALNYSFNHFDLPHLEDTKRTYLFGPRIDLTFSKSVFLTTFVQYNSQFENTNINARFQWRFAPVSDFYLVYTDNYFTGNPDDPNDRFTVDIRDRAIVAKMTYWLNL